MVTAPSLSPLQSLILIKGWKEEEEVAREDGEGTRTIDLVWGQWQIGRAHV